uniref:Bet1 golgi vesicular membrane trafficking protein-like n=1 Tax=Oncorhynchus mykiss TaxID=8022 RepID=A0A8L0DS56_ONCMY
MQSLHPNSAVVSTGFRKFADTSTAKMADWNRGQGAVDDMLDAENKLMADNLASKVSRLKSLAYDIDKEAEDQNSYLDGMVNLEWGQGNLNVAVCSKWLSSSASNEFPDVCSSKFNQSTLPFLFLGFQFSECYRTVDWQCEEVLWHGAIWKRQSQNPLLCLSRTGLCLLPALLSHLQGPELKSFNKNGNLVWLATFLSVIPRKTKYKLLL